MDNEIYREKLAQASALLTEMEIDCWLLFVRETGTLNDPSLPLLIDQAFTWETAILVSADGRHALLAGEYDCEAVRATGLFAEVVPYSEGMSAALRDLLTRRDPRRIALNYSPSDPIADGLTYGMWLKLNEMLVGTPYRSRFESAAAFVAKLRSVKTPGELFRMKAALREAEDLWARTGSFLHAGLSEQEIAAFMLAEVDRRGLGTSWEREQCPIVKVGGASISGHARPGETRLAPGHLLNIDFGVRRDGYCTDQQRMWYCRARGETSVPAEVQRAFEAVIGAIQAAATVLQPGLQGWEVDAVARRYVTEAGYPAYQHALGHTVGRTTHDGGPLLGPRWERYGNTPDGLVEAGQIFTLELGVDTPAGYCGVEEEVLVTPAGCEFLSPPQMALMYVET